MAFWHRLREADIGSGVSPYLSILLLLAQRRVAVLAPVTSKYGSDIKRIALAIGL